MSTDGPFGVDVDDLVQAGLVALTECAQKHSGPTEDGFAADAKLRVRGAMVDLVRRTMPLRAPVRPPPHLARKDQPVDDGTGPHAHRARTGPRAGPDRCRTGRLAPVERAGPPRIHRRCLCRQRPGLADERPDAFAQLADSETRHMVARAVGACPSGCNW
jgi:RNA polymerase sigma factor for flagellar operon FliA